MVEAALTRIEELREILHRLEEKIDALTLNRDQGSVATKLRDDRPNVSNDLILQ